MQVEWFEGVVKALPSCYPELECFAVPTVLLATFDTFYGGAIPDEWPDLTRALQGVMRCASWLCGYMGTASKSSMNWLTALRKIIPHAGNRRSRSGSDIGAEFMSNLTFRWYGDYPLAPVAEILAQTCAIWCHW